MKKIETVTKKEIVRAVGKASGVSQANTEAVLDAYFEVIYECLKEGTAVSLVGIGKIEPKYMEAKPERDVYVPLIKETVHKEAEPACYRAKFSASKVLLSRLKDASYESDIG